MFFFSETSTSDSVLEFGWSIAVLDFQNKILEPAGPQVFIFWSPEQLFYSPEIILKN